MLKSKPRMRMLIALALALAMCMTAQTIVYAGTTTTKYAVISYDRISGNDRIATAVAVSNRGWKTSNTVIIVNGDSFADALCAGPLAYKYKAPILLVSKDTLDTRVSDELMRLNASNIIIVGGEGVVSKTVFNSLKTIAESVVQLGGSDRYDTSIIVANELTEVNQVAIVSGENFPDALSISSIASRMGMPIILSSREGLTPNSLNYVIDSTTGTNYIIGGLGVLSNNIESSVSNTKRISGIDRYDTNTKVLNEFKDRIDFSTVIVATGEGFADALSGTAFAALANSPIVLSDSSRLSNEVDLLIETKSSGDIKIIAIGGSSVVSDSLLTDIVTTISADRKDGTVTPTTTSGGGGGGSSSGGGGSISSSKKELVSVGKSTDITVANGNTAGLLLPATTLVTYKDIDGSTKTEIANITWEIPPVGFSVFTAGTYSFAGTVTLPADLNNDSSVALTASQKVIVLPAAAKKELVSIESLVDINAVNGTEQGSLGLPSTVVATYTDLDGSTKTETASVAFNNGTPEYSATKAGIYSFTGTVVLPSDLSNDKSISLSVSQKVTVGAPVVKKELVSIGSLVDINVVNGTAQGSLRLPSTVVATYTDIDGSTKTETANVTFNNGTPVYSAAAGTYVFAGTVTLPSDLSNDNYVVLTASQKVIVAVTANTVVTNSVVSSVSTINITKPVGSDYTLPTTVIATLSDSTTKSLGVVWDKVASTTAVGTYGYTGTISIVNGIINTNNVKATATLTVVASTSSTLKISPPVGDTLCPSGLGFYINSVGGVFMKWSAKNYTGKTINYINANISMYNAVGDPAYDELNGKSNVSMKIIGPVSQNGTIMMYSILSYNGNCSEIVIDTLSIQYTDGTAENIPYGYSGTATLYKPKY